MQSVDPTGHIRHAAIGSEVNTEVMTKILVVFYTTYGHIYTMAKAMKEGIDKVEGCEAVLYQVLLFLRVFDARP